jgi:hypothetical protein
MTKTGRCSGTYLLNSLFGNVKNCPRLQNVGIFSKLKLLQNEYLVECLILCTF